MSLTSSIDSSSEVSSSLKRENLFLIEDKIPPLETLEILDPNLTFGESESSSISSSDSSWISSVSSSSVYGTSSLPSLSLSSVSSSSPPSSK